MRKSLNSSPLDCGSASSREMAPSSATPRLAAATARQLTDTLKQHMGELWERLLALHDGEAPEQLAEVILAAVEAKADANQDNVTVMAVRPVFAGEAAL